MEEFSLERWNHRPGEQAAGVPKPRPGINRAGVPPTPRCLPLMSGRGPTPKRLLYPIGDGDLVSRSALRQARYTLSERRRGDDDVLETDNGGDAASRYGW